MAQKFCLICGKPIGFFSKVKLSNGLCCQECLKARLPIKTPSPNLLSVNQLTQQIEYSKKNRETLMALSVSKIFGDATKIYIDEKKKSFFISNKSNYTIDNPFVFSFDDIVSCEFEITESKTEIRYKNSSNEIKSFNPPTYAHSYNFFIEMNLKNEYSSHVNIALNLRPIDNGQKTIIDLSKGGLLDKLSDTFGKTRTYNGNTSNASEVMSSLEYKKYFKMGESIEQFFGEAKKQILNSQKLKKCKWCGCSIEETVNNCPNCCGPNN